MAGEGLLDGSAPGMARARQFLESVGGGGATLPGGEPDSEFAQFVVRAFARYGDAIERRARFVGTVLFRPEAILCHRIPSALALLEERGLRPVAFRLVSLSARHTRALWDRPGHRPSAESQAMYDLITPQADWLLLAVESTNTAGEPVTELLHRSKGSAFPEHRQGSFTLRGMCGAPNRYFTMLHTADDWREILRESHLLLGPVAGLDWLGQISSEATGSWDPADRLTGVLRRETPRGFDLPVALEAVRTGLQANLADSGTASALARLQATLRRGAPFDVVRFLAECADSRQHLDDWSLAVVLGALAT
jgi:hypothetical protein